MGRPRRKPEWLKAGGGEQGDDLDALATALRNTSGDKLRAVLKRDQTFTFRLSEMDRETMGRAAEALDLPIAEYLIRLHYHAYDLLRREHPALFGETKKARARK